MPVRERPGRRRENKAQARPANRSGLRREESDPQRSLAGCGVRSRALAGTERRSFRGAGGKDISPRGGPSGLTGIEKSSPQRSFRLHAIEPRASAHRTGLQRTLVAKHRVHCRSPAARGAKRYSPLRCPGRLHGDCPRNRRHDLRARCRFVHATPSRRFAAQRFGWQRFGWRRGGWRRGGSRRGGGPARWRRSAVAAQPGGAAARPRRNPVAAQRGGAAARWRPSPVAPQRGRGAALWRRSPVAPQRVAAQPGRGAARSRRSAGRRSPARRFAAWRDFSCRRAASLAPAFRRAPRREIAVFTRCGLAGKDISPSGGPGGLTASRRIVPSAAFRAASLGATREAVANTHSEELSRDGARSRERLGELGPERHQPAGRTQRADGHREELSPAQLPAAFDRAGRRLLPIAEIQLPSRHLRVSSTGARARPKKTEPAVGIGGFGTSKQAFTHENRPPFSRSPLRMPWKAGPFRPPNR